MLQSWKAKAVAFFGFIASLLLVYFIGRTKRGGEVNVEIAKRELELANAKHEKLTAKVDALDKKRIDIVADIIAEETARVTREAGNKELSDAEVIERLRVDGLLR